MAKLSSGDLKKFITERLFLDPLWSPQPAPASYLKPKNWKRWAKFSFTAYEEFEAKGNFPLPDLFNGDLEWGTRPSDGTKYVARSFMFTATDDATADTQLTIITDADDERIVYCAASSD